MHHGVSFRIELSKGKVKEINQRVDFIKSHFWKDRMYMYHYNRAFKSKHTKSIATCISDHKIKKYWIDIHFNSVCNDVIDN